MSNLQLVQQLKQLVNCSSPTALDLLKQVNYDVQKAEKLFHEQNLASIQNLAKVDRQVAERFYFGSDCHLEKAIEKSKEWLWLDRTKQCFISTTGENHTPNGHCLVIYAENANNEIINDIKTIDKTWVCIPLADGRELLRSEIFDFYDWQSEELNYFTLEQIDNVIENLDKIQDDNPVIMQFYQELKHWLINCKPFAHHIIFDDGLS